MKNKLILTPPLCADFLISGVLRGAVLYLLVTMNLQAVGVLLAANAMVRLIATLFTPPNQRSNLFRTVRIGVNLVTAFAFYFTPAVPAWLIAGVALTSLYFTLIGLFMAVRMALPEDHPSALRLNQPITGR